MGGKFCAPVISGRRWRASRVFLIVHHRCGLGGPEEAGGVMSVARTHGDTERPVVPAWRPLSLTAAGLLLPCWCPPHGHALVSYFVTERCLCSCRPLASPFPPYRPTIAPGHSFTGGAKTSLASGPVDTAQAAPSVAEEAPHSAHIHAVHGGFVRVGVGHIAGIHGCRVRFCKNACGVMPQTGGAG